jgi:hypothetical protein
MQTEQAVVHSGTTAIEVALASFNSACWQTPTMLSRLSDYDSISFWLNAGASAPQDLRFLLYNGSDIVAKVDLATAYGAPLPASSWIHLVISLSDLPAEVGLPDPSRFDDMVIRTYTTGSGNDRFFIDDVVLIGADIFKDGFDG